MIFRRALRLSARQEHLLARGCGPAPAQQFIVLLILAVEAARFQKCTVAVQFLVVETAETLNHLLNFFCQIHSLGQHKVQF